MWCAAANAPAAATPAAVNRHPLASASLPQLVVSPLTKPASAGRRLLSITGPTTVTCSPVVPSPGHTFCGLTGLTPDSKYSVVATAVAPASEGGARSLPSNLDDFTTPSNE